MEEELKKIKKKYGENFAKLCRTLFPTILETEGRLYEILTTYFSNNSRTLYEDLTKNGLEGNFKNFIFSKIDVEHPDKIILEDKTPYELLDEVGYKLTECKTERAIQKFKKYYKPGEELCTFGGGRLEQCYVFFAVRKDVEDIRREDFDNPKREDEYGTSVMGIQFNKEGKCTVSIKNRYNHRVNNPDATYGNDLDRITPGLTQSFGKLLKVRGLELDSSNIEKFEMLNYVVANDGKYYKFNREINGIYYCPGNIVIENGEVHRIENPEQQMLIDYFKLDLKNKTLQVYDDRVKDCFPEGFYDIEKIDIVKNKEKRTRKINIYQKNQEEPIIIEIDENNQIIGYKNSNTTQVGDGFLKYNKRLKELEMPNLKEIGDDFLDSNMDLIRLSLPNVTSIGNGFLLWNFKLTELRMPNLKKIGTYFLHCNQSVTELEMPNITQIDDYSDESLTESERQYIKEHTERLSQIIKKNRAKIGDSQLNKPKVDEEKFEQIHNKAKGRINKVLLQIKSFFKSNDKENDER